MPKDMRQFLEMARKAGPDYYVEAKRPLSPDLEVNVLQEKLDKEGRYPVIYCPKVKGSKLPLCTNLFGSYDMLGLIMDFGPDTLKRVGRAQIQQEYMRRLNDAKPVQWVSAAEAPVKDVVITGGDIDISILPIAKGSELDSGKYISIGSLICRDATSGMLNMGVYRCEVKGKDTISYKPVPLHHIGYITRGYAEKGGKMEVVLCIGHHPAVSLAAVAAVHKVPDDELQSASGLLGEPLRVTKAETVDLPVPADAEIIIEGIVDPTQKAYDGPYAEFAYYYGGRRPCNLIQITAITMRKDAIYHHLDSAHREHNFCMQLSRESVVYQAVKRRIPTVKGVYAPPSACGFHKYISIAKRAQGEGMLAGMLALGADDRVKCAIIVDEDVNAFNEEEVLWAVATRVSWDKNVAIIPRMPEMQIDPRCYGESGLDYESGEIEVGEMVGKVIIDATMPVTIPYATRITPPKKLWESMKIEDYLR